MLRVVLMCLFMSFLLPSAGANPEFNQVKQQLSDSVISAKVSAKLAKRGELNPLKLSVSTKHGVVKLKGTVTDKKMFVDVLRLVKATKGVRGISIDDLKIKQVNTPITDAYITAKVEAAILKAKVFDDESIPLVGINARTDNGHVVLSGFVKKKTSIDFIVKRVLKVRGVKQVQSKLVLRHADQRAPIYP